MSYMWWPWYTGPWCVCKCALFRFLMMRLKSWNTHILRYMHWQLILNLQISWHIYKRVKKHRNHITFWFWFLLGFAMNLFFFFGASSLLDYCGANQGRRNRGARVPPTFFQSWKSALLDIKKCPFQIWKNENWGTENFLYLKRALFTCQKGSFYISKVPLLRWKGAFLTLHLKRGTF